MNPLSASLRGLVRLYQLAVSPFLGPSCRFVPTCSHYAHEAILRHGAVKGSWLALRRLVRCGPWGGWSYDPVPQAPDRRERGTATHSHAR